MAGLEYEERINVTVLYYIHSIVGGFRGNYQLFKAYMRKKIVEFPLFVALLISVPMMALSLFFIIAAGVLAGLFVELFHLHSRISNRELKKYRIAKPVEKDIVVLKPMKIYKLPLPEKVLSKGVFMSPLSEKELSEAR